MAPHTLAELLAPFDAEAFLRNCWSQNFQYFPGTPGRFSELLPWSVLNRILRQHRLDSPRIRLFREGESVPPNSFLSYQTSRRKTQIPRLRTAELTRELRNGATLVLDAVDELHDPITALAEALESVFRVRIQVNAYAGWRTSHGFDLHWDDHDVFIVQVAGRKQWKVYGMTRKYPLKADSGPDLHPPEAPLWEGLLEDGDLLYIPRGWWHVATPLDEPTLHLTIGVHNPTGMDLLSWFVDRLRTSEDVRQDLPRFASRPEQAAFADRIRNLFLEQWHPGLLQLYWGDMDAKAEPRPVLGLPWSAGRDALPPPGSPFQVKWNVPRPIIPKSNGHQEFEIACNGRSWRFAEGARPIVELLREKNSCSAAELHAVVSGHLDPQTVRAFLGELVSSGLAVIVDHSAPHE
ncbi:MAG: hypothetical protein JOZ48_08195 [Acidobacteriaceae bacterium]|nr:hypothetical protein [Acidobacteriaceae bacterium]